MKSLSFLKYLVTGLCLNVLVLGYASAKSNCTDTTVVPPFATSTYNNAYYNSILEATKALATPYLLHQGYYTMPGVTVNGTNIVYGGVSYGIDELYDQSSLYFVHDTDYAYYGINAATKIWTTKIPDVVYDSVLQKFFSRSDCSGFGCRLMAAVGGTTSTNNAYLNLAKRVNALKQSTIGGKNTTSNAFSIAVAFPQFTTAEIPGWQYVAGNVADSLINAYKNVGTTLNTYIGQRKGGFANSLPGDVLAFGYGPKATSTGHFMILDSVPRRLDSAGLKRFYPATKGSKVRTTLKKYRVYAASVIDDSGQFAHAQDSRKNYSGIGHGILLIMTDTLDDAPIGYVFKASVKDTSITFSALRDTNNVYAISVGRYISSKQLPVSLVSFSASRQSEKVVLNWHTANEENTNLFVVERSTNGIDFAAIGEEKAMESSNGSYAFADNNPYSGTNYYRLKTVDADGAIEYSKAVSIQTVTNGNKLLVYPNPSRNRLTINGSHIATVVVVDNNGRIVGRHSLGDATNPSLSVENLVAGAYYLRIRTMDGQVSEGSFVKE